MRRKDVFVVLPEDTAKVKPVMRWISKVVDSSKRTGAAVDLLVKVRPDGRLAVMQLERWGPPGVRAFKTSALPQPEKQKDSLAAARDRGRIQAAKVLAGIDMLNADDFAELLGITRATVNTKRQAGQLLGLEGVKRGFRFPKWQLNQEGKPYTELPHLIDQLGGPWAAYRFLVQRHAGLGGHTGREALELGMGSDVISAAEGIARGDFA